MTVIVYDPFRISDHQDACIISTPEDYVKVRLELANGSGQGEYLIANPGMKCYFDDIVQAGQAELKVYSLLNTLASRLPAGFIISETIKSNNKLVLELDLLSKAKTNPPNSEITNTDDWILYLFAGDPWQKDKWNSLNEMLNVMMTLASLKSKNYNQVIQDLFTNKLSKVNSDNSMVKNILIWLNQEPLKRSKAFLSLLFVRNYKDNKKAQLLQKDGYWSEVCQLRDYNQIAQKMSLKIEEDYLDKQIKTQIEAYLRQKLDSCSNVNEFINIIGMIDGNLAFETQLFYDFLLNSNKAHLLTNDVLRLVIDKFNGLSETIVADQARQMIKPEKALRALPVSAHWHETKTWLKKEFFPYYNWCCINENLTGAIEAIASFEEWYSEHFSSITWEKDILAHTIIKSCNEKISSTGHKDYAQLIIILDGVGFQWSRQIEEQLIHTGIYPLDETSLFLSFVPTTTYINKSAILSGKLPEQINCPNSGIEVYKKLLSESIGIADKKVVCATDKESCISELLTIEASHYLYFLNQTDEIVHEHYSSYHQRKLCIEKRLNDFFADLAKSIKTYKGKHKKPLFVILTSDHGNTMIFGEGKSISCPPETQITHCRVAEGLVTDPDEYDGLYSEVKHKDKLLNIARGLNYFGSKPKGAAHGGMTPQEAVIPCLLFCTEDLSRKLPISISIEGEIKRGKADNTLLLTLINPNAYSINLTSVTGDRFKSVSALPVIFQDQTSVDLLFDASGYNKAEVDIKLSIAYELLNIQLSDSFNIRMKTSGAAIVNNEFEDDFDV